MRYNAVHRGAVCLYSELFFGILLPFFLFYCMGGYTYVWQEPLEAVRGVAGDIKCVIIHAGNLFGSSGGEEPVPFLTGPKAEPVLDESITRQAVLVGPGTVLSTVRFFCSCWDDG